MSDLRLPMLTLADKLDEIKRLYYRTTKQTIARDLARALDLAKSIPSEAERERVAVYLDGLAQMQADWARRKRRNDF